MGLVRAMKFCAGSLVLGTLAPSVLAKSAAEMIVHEARESIGIPYRYARQSGTSTDCAGLVRRVAAVAGIKIPRTSRAQYRTGRAIRASDLEPGDLVFFKNTYRLGISHVGIYIGAGEFIHAASGQKKVVIDRLDVAYFARRYAGARRIVSDREPPFPRLCAVP